MQAGLRLRSASKGSSNVDISPRLRAKPDRPRWIRRPVAPNVTARQPGVPPGDEKTCRFYAALSVTPAASGSPSSIGSEGSRDHSFQEPKYIRTSFTPAFLSARNVFEARAPLKQ